MRVLQGAYRRPGSHLIPPDGEMDFCKGVGAVLVHSFSLFLVVTRRGSLLGRLELPLTSDEGGSGKERGHVALISTNPHP